MVNIPDSNRDPQKTTPVVGLSYICTLPVNYESTLNTTPSSCDTIAESCTTSTTSAESLGSCNSLCSVVSAVNYAESQASAVSPTAVGSCSSPICSRKHTHHQHNDMPGVHKHHFSKEKWWSVTLQVAVPFFIAGMGTIGAGIVLGKVQSLEVFKKINNLIVLIPPILGLKGNLDMCLASRLSTQANIGNLNTFRRDSCKIVAGNVAVVQVQAIVAATVVSMFALVFGSLTSGNGFSEPKIFFQNFVFLASCSTLTATVSCFALDLLMILVIIFSHRWKLNPDNLATPLAASIGDIVSLLMLSFVASKLFTIYDSHFWILYVILSVYLFIFLPILVFLVRRSKYTSEVLVAGWLPVISALFISGMGGLVLGKAMGNFAGFEVFQPIINGIGGNLVSVQSSRVSTMLHQNSIRGIIPPHTKQWVAPWTALFRGSIVHPAKTARILIAMNIVGQTIFAVIADFIHSGKNTVTVVFIATYVSVSLLQVMILLYICHLLVHGMWRMKKDPDNSSIPYLTSLGDFIGSSLLLLAFMFLREINWEYDSDSSAG